MVVATETGERSRLMDHADGYGLVSRFFHWFMALLLLWQAISALLHYFADDTPIADFFFQYHFTNGFTILVLAVFRGAWGLLNLSRRPVHNHGIERAAPVVHFAIYTLLIAVPLIAVIRAYGSERPFSVYGIQLFSGSNPEIEWMTGLGGLLHGELGWILVFLITGHIIMAFVHSVLWKQRVIARMTTGHGKI